MYETTIHKINTNQNQFLNHRNLMKINNIKANYLNINDKITRHDNNHKLNLTDDIESLFYHIHGSALFYQELADD